MVHSKACDQRSALMGEPICIVCLQLIVDRIIISVILYCRYVVDTVNIFAIGLRKTSAVWNVGISVGIASHPNAWTRAQRTKYMISDRIIAFQLKEKTYHLPSRHLIRFRHKSLKISTRSIVSFQHQCRCKQFQPS